MFGIKTYEWIEKYPDIDKVLEAHLADWGVPEKNISHCKTYCQCDDKTVFFSPRGVSVLLNVSRNNVQGRVKNGKVKAERDVCGFWLVPFNEVEKMKEQYGVRKEYQF